MKVTFSRNHMNGRHISQFSSVQLAHQFSLSQFPWVYSISRACDLSLPSGCTRLLFSDRAFLMAGRCPSPPVTHQPYPRSRHTAGDRAHRDFPPTLILPVAVSHQGHHHLMISYLQFLLGMNQSDLKRAISCARRV